mmetsp:Transcript_21770/g.30455  ORF Transcript_21770/g.30455 Transcript_21770/m.30455 type:complete len:173 (-) Transcript_21770:5-523(-)
MSHTDNATTQHILHKLEESFNNNPTFKEWAVSVLKEVESELAPVPTSAPSKAIDERDSSSSPKPASGSPNSNNNNSNNPPPNSFTAVRQRGESISESSDTSPPEKESSSQGSSGKGTVPLIFKPLELIIKTIQGLFEVTKIDKQVLFTSLLQFLLKLGGTAQSQIKHPTLED